MVTADDAQDLIAQLLDRRARDLVAHGTASIRPPPPQLTY